MWALTASNSYMSNSYDREHYKWIKNLSEMPYPTPGEDSNSVWQVLVQPSKPGIEYYDLSYFVVSITARYPSAAAAGQAVSKRINTIISPPEDFGLGGEWKLDESQVSYDGKTWIAHEVYTRAVD